MVAIKYIVAIINIRMDKVNKWSTIKKRTINKILHKNFRRGSNLCTNVFKFTYFPIIALFIFYLDLFFFVIISLSLAASSSRDVTLPILNPFFSNLLTKDNSLVGIKLFSIKNSLLHNISYVFPS
nr:hypothetical protein [Ehrlichia ruminantium]